MVFLMNIEQKDLKCTYRIHASASRGISSNVPTLRHSETGELYTCVRAYTRVSTLYAGSDLRRVKIFTSLEQGSTSFFMVARSKLFPVTSKLL